MNAYIIIGKNILKTVPTSKHNELIDFWHKKILLDLEHNIRNKEFPSICFFAGHGEIKDSCFYFIRRLKLDSQFRLLSTSKNKSIQISIKNHTF